MGHFKAQDASLGLLSRKKRLIKSLYFSGYFECQKQKKQEAAFGVKTASCFYHLGKTGTNGPGKIKN